MTTGSFYLLLLVSFYRPMPSFRFRLQSIVSNFYPTLGYRTKCTFASTRHPVPPDSVNNSVGSSNDELIDYTHLGKLTCLRSEDEVGWNVIRETRRHPRSKSDTPTRKFRQHVNPLASAYQQPTYLETDWVKRYFSEPSKPFIVDIGCSKGTWALNMCEKSTDINILGLEIRSNTSMYKIYICVLYNVI